MIEDIVLIALFIISIPALILLTSIVGLMVIERVTDQHGQIVYNHHMKLMDRWI